MTVSPKHANTLYNYGVMLDTHLSRKPEAERLYRRALEEEPRHPFALYNLAVLLEERLSDAAGGDGAPPLTAEVQSFYQRAIDADPRDPHTKADFARFLLSRTKDTDKAAELLNLALTIDPQCELAIRTMTSLKQPVPKRA